MHAQLFTLLPLLALAHGLPSGSPPLSELSSRQTGFQVNFTEAILTIMPTSNTCAGADFPMECRTADQAAPYVSAAFYSYATNSSGEMAALLALMGYESVDFKYKHNVDPGTPGQGTANMQMPNFNFEYAQYLNLDPQSNETVATLQSTMVDDYNFGSASWFITTQSGCAAPRKQLQAGGTETELTTAFTNYMEQCIQTPATTERLAYWTRATGYFIKSS